VVGDLAPGGAELGGRGGLGRGGGEGEVLGGGVG